MQNQVNKIVGVIGVSGAELARYAVFYDSLLHIQGMPGVAIIIGKGANIAENRNGITERALALNADWILYLDDDHTLPPFILSNLLRHNVDVVGGLYVGRSVPFIPRMFDRESPEHGVYARLLNKHDKGLIECLAVGSGALLVKTDVIKKLEKPYWRLGAIKSDVWSDDIEFCKRVREAGFKLFCDLETPVGHQMTGTLWPVRDNETGEWTTRFIVGNDVIAAWPSACEKEPSLIINPNEPTPKKFRIV